MKVLLIQPPIEDFYTTPIRLYPLGLLYVAATLKKLGCDVSLLDCLAPPKKRQRSIPSYFSYLKTHFENNPYLFRGYYRFGMTDETIMNHIRRLQPDRIGIASQFSAYFESVNKLATMIKSEMDVPIFIGGNHATAFGDEIKSRTSAIDDVLTGPAETALPPYFASLDAEHIASSPIDWKSIRPAHHLLLGENYRMGRKNYISLVASRGCPHKCEFCSVHNMFGRRMDYRDTIDVLDEMRQNYVDKKARIFNFEDDNISANRSWFVELLQRIIADPVLLDVELTALNGLCYPSLDEELLGLMYKAGFRQLHLSYVTHDPLLRRKLGRPAEKKTLESAIAAAQKLGFFITVYVILGLPGQTYEEAKNSINYLLGLNVLVGPSVFYIPPGSELYPKLKLPDAIKENWNLYRSSAFAVETSELDRAQLVELFAYTREQNLARRENRRT